MDFDGENYNIYSDNQKTLKKEYDFQNCTLKSRNYLKFDNFVVYTHRPITLNRAEFNKCLVNLQCNNT